MGRIASQTNVGPHGGQLVPLSSGAPLGLSSGAPLGNSLGGLEGGPAHQLMQMVAQLQSGRGVRTHDDGDGGIPLEFVHPRHQIHGGHQVVVFFFLFLCFVNVNFAQQKEQNVSFAFRHVFLFVFAV